MSIGFRDSTSVSADSSGTTTVVPLPSGATTGDRMIAFVGSIGAAPTITPPAGWTLLAEQATTTVMRTAAYYRDPGGSEGSTYTWTWSSSGRTIGMISCFTGVDLTIAPVESINEITSAGAGPHSTTALTLNQDDWLVYGALSRESPGTATAITWTTSDGSDVEREEETAANTGTSNQMGGVSYDSNRNLAAGSTTRSVTANKSMEKTHVWAVRIRPIVVASGGWTFGLPVR